MQRIVSAMALLACGLTALPMAAAEPKATWTIGAKKVLIIPVRFTDVAGPSDAPGPGGKYSGWGDIVSGVETARINAFFQRQSYGLCSMEFTVLPEIDMGVSWTVYTANYGNSGLSKLANWSEPGSFADDIRAKAREVGIAAGSPALYDTDNYDLDVIACGFIPTQGVGASGRPFGKGVYGTGFKALSHEFGHNFGCQHANGISRGSGYLPVKSGSYFIDTYGDVFDLLGWKDTSPTPLPLDREANVFWKHLMGWLPNAHILDPSASGIYRIHAFDQGSLEPGKHYALRVERDPNRTYWFSFRQDITGPGALWSQNGLEVRIGGESFVASSGHTTLLDTTPGSRGLPGNAYATMYDAPLAVGRTYSDPEAGLHVTPVRKAGTTPESLDVVVQFGAFPGNGTPTVSIAPTNAAVSAGIAQVFTATASDPNGDPLAYYWEFDDPDAPGGSVAGNAHPDARLSTQGSHVWARNGVHLVRCTVTDMRGRTRIASANVTVTGGTPANLTISGLVRDEEGNPLQGAIVHNYKQGPTNPVSYGATNFAGSSETAADGRYVVQVPPVGNQTYYLSVLHGGYSFNCTSSAGGAVTVTNASRTNIHFSRIRSNRTLSGAVYVAGRGYDPVTDGDLTVSIGNQTANVSGSSWQLSVPDGAPLALVATAANPGYTFGEFAPNPYLVVDDLNLMHLFATLPGKMPGIGFASPSGSSDDSVGTVQVPVVLSLPAGMNAWPANQAIHYWVDPASTAEYGVDYKMPGGRITFYGGHAPTPQLLDLKILPTGLPKKKTVVIKLSPASSVAALGPITTFTYTIENTFRITDVRRTAGVIELTWQSSSAGNYTVQSAPDLSGGWIDVPGHIGLPGLPGSMMRSIPTGAAPTQFYRIRADE
jgi:hypothetical protein